jgi:drug/metabolite transporter (DMT)-like permease
MPMLWIGLGLAFVGAVVTNMAYSLEHDAAAALPRLSPRRPLRVVDFLIHDTRWLKAFGAETAGWLMYVAALKLAPLALVQAVTASGVAVLAFATARGHPSRLARREQAAVVLALAGLLLLGMSLFGREPSEHRPPVVGIVIWLAVCGGAAILLILQPTRFGRAATLGLAAGLLFADGDTSAKLIGFGGLWLLALVPLIIAYGTGTSVLQTAYQRGDALTAAGMATMVTNAVPIVAGFVLFGERLPSGGLAVLQVLAFGCLVLSAVALGHQQVPQQQAAPQQAQAAEPAAQGRPPEG